MASVLNMQSLGATATPALAAWSTISSSECGKKGWSTISRNHCGNVAFR